ncbi:MAG: sulfite exporter TauE/SafE family protein [Nitriliruptoraceae bacterium]
MGEVITPLLATAGIAGTLLVIAAALLGGVAQGTVGFGAAFATVPALAVTVPELLPGAMLVASLPLSTSMAILERENLDGPAAMRLMLGRLPGIAIGTLVVLWADVRLLTALIATVLLFAVAAAGAGWHLEVTGRREVIAGVLSGITGTAAALAGPPVAVLYRDKDPAVMRPTLGLVWAIGIVVTIASLAAAGEFTVAQAAVGLPLGAVVLAGLGLGRIVIARVSAARIRAGILWWAGVGGFAALVRVALG